MINRYKTLYIFAIFLAVFTNANASKIKNFILDSSRIYTINVAENHGGTTTVMFPDAINSLQGTNITAEAGKAGAYIVTYNPGSYFFSLEAQTANIPGADVNGSINVVYDRNIYVLDIVTVSRDEAYSSVTFQNRNKLVSKSSSQNGLSAVTPTVIRDIIEKAKLYPILKNEYPEYYENVEIARKEQLFKYTGYQVLLENVYRFELDDTVVFQTVFKNNTEKTLVYDPHLIAARLGSKMYYTSATIGSGQIPSHGETPVWFAITGNPTGGRNEMAADNDWTVLMTAGKINAKSSTLNINQKIIEKENELKTQMAEINKRLSTDAMNLTPSEIDLLSKKITDIDNELKDIQSTQLYM